MAIAGPVIGAVGTVAQMGAQAGAARRQNQALQEQRDLQTRQYALLQEQRKTQRMVAEAESSRAREAENLAQNQQLFNLRLQEQAQQTQQLREEFSNAQAEFATNQQALTQQQQAYGAEIGAMNQLFELGQQARGQAEEMRQAQGEMVAAQGARGQGDSESSLSAMSRIAEAMGTGEQRLVQIFNQMMAQSDQNIEVGNVLAQLQQEMGLSEVELKRLLDDLNMKSNQTVIDYARKASQNEYAMNQAAIDNELASRLFSIESAESADAVSNASTQASLRAQQQAARASGPGLFDIMGGLATAGMSVYDALTPVQSAPVRQLNPLDAPYTFGGPSLGGLPSFGQQRPTSNGKPIGFDAMQIHRTPGPAPGAKPFTRGLGLFDIGY